MLGDLRVAGCGVFPCFDDSTLKVQGSTLEITETNGRQEEIGTEL
jgi:hypothetical protein